MLYVVYEKESTRRIDNLNGGPKKMCFNTMASAQAARTRFLKNQLVYTKDDILIEEANKFYAEIEKEIHGKSAFDGSPVTVKANTPYNCDPRFERYWAA